MAAVEAKNPGEVEFHQAVREVATSIELLLEREPVYREAKILERMIEPERVLMCRVPWVDDHGEICVNRGFRVEMSSAIGPYKGGLRFHPTVDLGVLKCIGRQSVILGVLDLGTSAIEPAEEVAARIRRGLEHVPAGRLIPAPDCGMKYLTRDTAFGKLRALAAGAAIVRAELA